MFKRESILFSFFLLLAILPFQLSAQGDWFQIGLDIDGEVAQDRSAIDMSADGNYVVIGAELNDDAAIDAGHARVYEFSGGVWTQIGSDIDGELAYDWSGSGVSINNAGDRVAIGARRNDGGGSSSGHVRVYENSGEVWVPKV